MPSLPVLTSIFQPEAVAQHLSAAYDLGGAASCSFFRQGLNDTYWVVGGNGRHYCLRVYRHGWRSSEAVQAEIDLLMRLTEAGLPVSVPIADAMGEWVQEWDAPEGVRLAVLFAAAPGIMVKDTAVSQSRTLGQIAGRLHSLTDSLELTYPRPKFDETYFIHEPLRNIQAIWGEKSAELDMLARLGERLERWLVELPCEPPFSGLCHGDLHSENVHFTEDGEATLFDFDCFGYGCRAYDLATFLWSRYLFASSEQKRQRTWLAFLEGYERERPLPMNTLPAVLRFVVLRQLWVMGIHAGAVTHHYGRRWLDEGYAAKHFGLLQRLVSDFKLA
ncbi:MAG: phosphotransferase [Ardenticatenaceae bacterium]|nr:phosphotransferase [Anaerolineales bacterium]MCB8921739.1 phosphotransferase [Ardenticatenaceae bacterium]MCB8990742.1 phosphotransferase [Ardenticatenaceae bacterium]